MSEREYKIEEIRSKIEIRKSWRSNFDSELFSKMDYQQSAYFTKNPYTPKDHQF